MSARVSCSLLAAQSDERLVELVREGHERAFEAVVQRYRRPLLRYCGRIGLSDARGEDAVQHALLQAWLALAGGAQVRELRPWLYRIAHNTAVNTIRSGSRDDGPLPDTDCGIDDMAMAECSLERSIAVRDALTEVAALPELQREAILLSAVDGRSHEEVASVLGVSHGAVRGLLYRARTTLRAAAAAITPQPLISWASGCVGRNAPTAERIAALCAPGSTAGMTGTLLKGGAMALSAAVFVAGAAVVPLKRHVNHHSKHPASSAGTRGAPVRAATSASRFLTAGGPHTAAPPSTSGGGLARAGSGAAKLVDETRARPGAPGGGERAPAAPSTGVGRPLAPVPALASPGESPSAAAGPGPRETGSQGTTEAGGRSGVSTSPGEAGHSGGPAQPPGGGSGDGSGASESGSPGKGPRAEGSGGGSGDGGEGSDDGLREGGVSTGSGREATETESSVDHSSAAGSKAASAQASVERGD